jgi:HTH-type transcriptional regulator / antitoxin HipB
LTNTVISGKLTLSEFQVSAMMPASHTLLTTGQLGSMLLATRKARGLTQLALANRIGLSQSRVSHLEQNAHELSAAQLLAWCAVLGLELSIGTRDSAGVLAAPSADW